MRTPRHNSQKEKRTLTAIDCLLVHVSSKQQNNRVFTMAMGLVPLAGMLERRGIRCQVIHTEVERRLNQDFCLSRYVEEHHVRIVGFSLHWHFQLFTTLEEVKEVRTEHPNIVIVLGGFTASYFSRDILKYFREVNFVIRGDAELPLAQLTEEICKGNGRNFATIPNLTWREDERIIENEQSYVATANDLNQLRYGEVSLIAHYQKYYLYCGDTFYYNIGRGCPVTCSFCGGSKMSQVILNQRREVTYKQVDEIIEDLQEFKAQGLHHWYTCFDPVPGDESFYLRLFQVIREKNLQFQITFESWAIPSKEFIESFVRTFDTDVSMIIISPESGSEKVRRRNKGYFYTNHDFITTLRYLSELKLRAMLYFSTGLPGETHVDFAQTLDLINFLRHHFPQYIANILPIALEPASPWFFDPEGYGIKSRRNTFLEFYNASKDEKLLGYDTGYFDENDIRTAITVLRMEAACNRAESGMLRFIRDQIERYEDGEPMDWLEILAQCQNCPHFYACHAMSTKYN